MVYRNESKNGEILKRGGDSGERRAFVGVVSVVPLILIKAHMQGIHF